MQRLAFALVFILAFSQTVFAKGIQLIGAGSTFGYPLYARMAQAYYKKTGVMVNYQPIGSGGGQRQLLNKIVDFGASDVFMTNEQLKDAPAKILHLPTCLGAVAITYNLPGNPVLRFTPSVLADIFLGKITHWNDPRIQKINPRVSLPNLPIATIHRSDGSGDTGIFTDYLSKVSREWKANVGEGLSVNWPGGLASKGNEGVAGLIRQIPGSIGYVTLVYTLQNHMPQAFIENKHGFFIKPTLESVSLSANVPLPPDTRVLVTNSNAPKAYPISGFTWLLFYKEQDYNGRSLAQAQALAKFLWWVVHEGQAFTKPMEYAPLPPKAVKLDEKILKSMTYNGKPIL
jgi:phosphate transport system substrate-binding protein